ncbi:hypothetical protein L1987_14865 [Smallanthus sonchifolius]|uniref:Uncharacterized protein n=1 Tax=Smallanthus sonchifolius TaxID=185202 RepID=A0ACB9J4I3_9ASTR|nr:hypothetical protein L1987_14865 [Smallanthus sonchifolius]
MIWDLNCDVQRLQPCSHVLSLSLYIYTYDIYIHMHTYMFMFLTYIGMKQKGVWKALFIRPCYWLFFQSPRVCVC